MATEAELTDTIQRVKAALLALGDLRPGALSEQYNTCRTPWMQSSPIARSCTTSPSSPKTCCHHESLR